MTRFLSFLLGCLLIFNLTACSLTTENIGTNQQALISKPLTQDQLIKHITNSTVALVVQTEEGWRPNCTGVWINQTTIITAAHCVEPDEVIGRKTPPVIGSRVYYVVASEVMGLGEDPSATHLGVVVAWDHPHDLAMVRVVGNAYPTHENASLGPVPAIGDNVHMVGHLQGFYYSYTHGFVSAYRPHMPKEEGFRKEGPFLQVSMPLWHGNSGGGAFNDHGELIGIACFIVEAPDVGFLISIGTVRQFIFDNKNK